MDIENLILTELKSQKKSVKDAYEALGVSKQTFYNKIKASRPDADFLTKVNNYLNIDLHPANEILKIDPQNEVVTALRHNRNPHKLIPFYNTDFMAGNSETVYSDGSDHPDYYMDIPEFYGCTAFRAFGDSMEPIIKSSCILFGTKEEEWNISLEYGQIYGITMLNGRRYLKYIRRADDHKHMFLLKSENPSYDDFEIRKDRIKNIWLIQGWIDKRA